MVKLILLVLLFVLVARALLQLFRGALEGAGYRRDDRPARGGTPSVNLVRDPVCGVFVVPGKALTSGTGSDTRYFCSEKCRSEWRRS